MSEIYIDNNCKVCSSYGNWINKKNNNLKLYNQKNLSENEIMLDTLVFKKEENVYYFSDAVIMSIASLGGFYKSIYILKLFPKRIRDFVYNIFAKNRHII
jgi:predicted DCC family thiol-disulfide oxidoreductase YuxK